MSDESKLELRVLRTISEGSRTPAELKSKLRKDVGSTLRTLRADNSIETADGVLKLTKRGAGRLRFAS